MTNRPEPAPSLNLPAGRKVDDYSIVELIGKGGMGEVYLATDARKPAAFSAALKILYPHLAKKSGDYTRRFLREARIAKQFNHPNLVQIYGCNFCDQEGFYYIAQEYVGGGSLRQLIANDTVLAEADALRIGIGVARALEAAHQFHIVHRDIKPDNIMFTLDGTVKLTDWGIAKNIKQTSLGTFSNLDLTMHNAFIGTPLYASPEQLQNSRMVDIRADIYSLGATIYYSLVGKPPLSGTTEMESLCVILTQPAPDVRNARPDVSEKTAATLAAMLMKDPEKRPQNPTVLLAEFLEAAQIFSQQNDISMEELASGTGIRGLEKHHRGKEADEPRRPPATSPPEPTTPKNRTQSPDLPAPPTPPPAEARARPFLDNLDATLSDKQTYANRRQTPEKKADQQPPASPPITATAPQPPPEPKLLPESHDNTPTTKTVSWPAPETRKTPFFWKLAIAICLAGLTLVGSWYGWQEYKYHDLLKQGSKTVEQKHFDEAQDHFNAAGGIKINDVRWANGIKFTNLIADAVNLEATPPANWPEILKLYEKALAIKGFEKSDVASQGEQSARQNMATQLLIDIDAAIQAQDWNRTRELLHEKTQTLGLKDNDEDKKLKERVDAEIKYFDLCRQAENFRSHNDPDSAEKCYRNALALNASTNSQDAIEGLAKILLDKAKNQAQENQFAEARQTLEWFQNDVSTTEAGPEQKFHQNLSAKDRTTATSLIADIKRREDEYNREQVSLNFDASIANGAKTMETGDYDLAITHFRQAGEIADKTANADWSKQASSKLEDAWSAKARLLCRSANGSLDSQPPITADAEKCLDEANKCLLELPDDSARRAELQTQIAALKKRLTDMEIGPLRQKYDDIIAAIKESLPAAIDPGTAIAARLLIMKTAAASMKDAFALHGDIARIDPASTRNDHLEVQSKLNQALYAAASELLVQSQKQEPPALELKFCQNAQECLRLLLEEMPTGPDDDKVHPQAQLLRNQANQEKIFLELLVQTNQHLLNQELDKAITCLAEARSREGFAADSRALALSQKIDEAKKLLDEAKKLALRNELLAQAKNHEHNLEWTKAIEAYESILKIPGFENDQAALEGIKGARQGAASDSLVDKAKSARDLRLWPEAEQALLDAAALRVRYLEIETLLNEVYQLWHDALLNQAAALMTAPDAAKTLLSQAKSIRKNTPDVWEKWFALVKTTSEQAVNDKTWPAINGLLALAEEIPGFQGNRQIQLLVYQSRCKEGERLYQDYQFDDALMQYQAAKDIKGLKDYHEAEEGLCIVKKAIKAETDFEAALNEFKTTCETCLRTRLTDSRDNTDFLRCLDDCWTPLKNFPTGEPRKEKEKQITTLMGAVLLNDAEYFVNDAHFLALSGQAQQNKKIAFLKIVAECNTIAGGNISALPDNDPLRINVEGFFEKDAWPTPEDQAAIMEIPWLRSHFPPHQPE